MTNSTSKVEGTFFPENKEELEKLIASFKKEEVKFPTRAVVAPHAGYQYSGELAYRAISLINRDVKNIFIIAPAHKLYFKGMALLNHDYIVTPLGRIEVNREINNELKEEFECEFKTEAFVDEHAIEVQVPLIQSLFDEIKIIPIVICDMPPDKIVKILEKYYPDKDNAFVISSDLSHYLTDIEAMKLDTITAIKIETGDLKDFQTNMACNAISLYALSYFARQNNYSLIRLDLYNSSKTTNYIERVVGYGAWGLYEDKKNNFIKQNYRDVLIDIVKKSIRDEKIPAYPKVLDEIGACFVTLNKSGNLRGCIGSIIPHRPLIVDLVINSKNAAYNDPRFRAVQKDELDELDIEISLLSEPVEMRFNDEEDLLNQIKENEDGIIIQDKEAKAVYLPSVWGQLHDKKVFLSSLKLKAGLPHDHFSDTFKAYKFSATMIK